jgi:hypothetical protein
MLVRALAASVVLRSVGAWLVGAADILWEASTAFLGASVALALAPPGAVGGLARHPWLLIVIAVAVMAFAWWVRSRLTALVRLAQERTATG